MPNLFNKKILNNRIKDFSVENIDEKIEKIKNWQQSLSKIKGLNEKRLQSAFLKAIFEDILGYENSPQKEEWTLDIEATTDVDAKHPDGILGFFERVDNEEIRGHEGVIELKGPQISLDKDQKRQGTTYKSPVDQAFSYTNKLDKCKWVIVSNFMEIRLYKVGRSKEYYEVFLLDELDEIENFKKFYYLLNKDNLLSKAGESITYKLSEKTLKKEEDISVKFYNLYKNVRINLFEHLKENNPEKNPELLLEKAQKFLDRIIFIGFCEDKGLLPNDLLHEAIQRGKESFSPSNTAVWDQIRGVFRSIDEGNAAHDINAYNGGLFKYDNDLDGLVIENNFFEAIYKISDYDFDSDVDVNILGHIFEQSISDLEKLKSDIKDNEFDENESKRKKDGIFYTPQYITSYIVENAIGGYLEDLKEKLGYYELPDIENAGSDSWETRYTKQHLEFYNKYEKNLKEIKVLDPACGSGAFLNQAFDYLLEEHNWLNKQRDLLKGGQSSIFALDLVQRDILKNNIFGVDLNEESVEITKLSLWLKTANKRKTLTNLDDNIKCGNSLIDDPEIAADKAFDWEKEFENIMNDGGFDIVIGNPPYIRIQNMEDSIIKYFNNYEVSYKNYDIYTIFVEKSLELINDSGNVSFIMPRKFINSDYGKKLKKYLYKNKYLDSFLDFGTVQIFNDATTYTGIFLFNKKDKSNFKYNKIYSKSDLLYLEKTQYTEISFENIKKEIWLLNSKKEKDIFNKLNDNKKMKELIDKAFQGLITGADSIYILEITDNGLYSKFTNEVYEFDCDIIKPLLKGSEIKRYSIPNEKYILIFPYRINEEEIELISKKEMKNNYKDIWNYFKDCEEKLRSRDGGKLNDDKWWRFSRNQNLTCFEDEKILTQVLAQHSSLTLDKDKNYYFVGGGTAGGYGVKIKDQSNLSYEYLLGILNSSLIEWYIQNYASEFRGGYYAYNKTTMEKLPIVVDLNFEDIIVDSVNKIINMKDKLKEKNNFKFIKYINKYISSLNNTDLNTIIYESGFSNELYSGRASKIRKFTVNINTNIITIYLDKSSSGKYEVLKFEENDKNKRKYIKYYLENLTDEQLDKIDNKYKGNILKKTLQIKIPDYNKDHVVKKVVKEWSDLQKEILNLEENIRKIDNEIDQMAYNLYDLTEEEIKIVENS